MDATTQGLQFCPKTISFHMEYPTREPLSEITHWRIRKDPEV